MSLRSGGFPPRACANRTGPTYASRAAVPRPGGANVPGGSALSREWGRAAAAGRSPDPRSSFGPVQTNPREADARPAYTRARRTANMQQPFRLVRSRNGIQGRVLDPRDPNRRTFGRWAATV
jgi:hypothetical protein